MWVFFNTQLCVFLHLFSVYFYQEKSLNKIFKKYLVINHIIMMPSSQWSWDSVVQLCPQWPSKLNKIYVIPVPLVYNQNLSLHLASHLDMPNTTVFMISPQLWPCYIIKCNYYLKFQKSYAIQGFYTLRNHIFKKKKRNDIFLPHNVKKIFQYFRWFIASFNKDMVLTTMCKHCFRWWGHSNKDDCPYRAYVLVNKYI